MSCNDCNSTNTNQVIDHKTAINQLLEQRISLLEQVKSGNIFAQASLDFIDNILSQFSQTNSNNNCKGCGE